MPRYDDRYGNTRLYVGRLSSRTRSRDLDRLFSRYGRVRDVDMKRDFAFVEFGDPRDADDARYSLDGREFDGSRLIVEFAKGGPRGSREYLGRGPPPGSGRCFNCGLDGHWARDCKAGDWKNKCYRCGERGHIERQCNNSPKELRRGGSLSRSPVRSRSPRRGRSPSRSYSRSHSYSRSRSPVRRGRSYDRDGGSRSPVPSKTRKRSRSVTPDDISPKARDSISPINGRLADEQDDDYSGSPRARSRSPISPERDSPVGRRFRSPNKTNGRSQSPNPSPSPSPSPKDDRSPVDDDDENRRSPRRGSESP
ncbi:hypothetical protein F8388_008910 [Cannabis sativa]|uniref:Uncharacterized protein n=1 Tax=Cannabis sativa TaxID=3483 RepID=A0A7J6H8B0_CANSA|nr:hypothetical protein F8388_008910 [Cannabis sativa]